MQDKININKKVSALYTRYNTFVHIYHVVSILFNIFTIVVCPILILLDYYFVTKIVIASSIVGFINNIVFQMSGISTKCKEKANRCLKLQKVLLKNKTPTPKFISLCKLEIKEIENPIFVCDCFKKRKESTTITNTSNSAEEIYQIERYFLFETN